MITTAASIPLKLEPYSRVRLAAPNGPGFGSKVRQAAPYRCFILGVSEAELEWGYVHETQLNSGDSEWVYPVGFYGEPMGGVGGACH